MNKESLEAFHICQIFVLIIVTIFVRILIKAAENPLL